MQKIYLEVSADDVTYIGKNGKRCNVAMDDISPVEE